MRQDHKRLLAAVVCAEFILGPSIAVPGNLCASQPRLAGNHLGVLALLADDGHVSGLVLQSHSHMSLAVFSICSTGPSARISLRKTNAARASSCSTYWEFLTLGLDAAVTMPGILTSRETCSDCRHTEGNCQHMCTCTNLSLSSGHGCCC